MKFELSSSEANTLALLFSHFKRSSFFYFSLSSEERVHIDNCIAKLNSLHSEEEVT